VSVRPVRPFLAAAAAASLALPIWLGGATASGATPVAPGNLQVAAVKAGFALFWSGHGVSTFQVEQADDSAMSTNLLHYNVHNGYTQFTPFDVTKGTTYYFRVRASSGSHASAWTHVVSNAPVTALQSIRVMTYNILENSSDGHSEGGKTIASWSKRRLGAAKLIRKQAPDAVAIEEGATYVGSPAKHVRQIDSLESALGSPYRIAPTETVYPGRGWFRTGDYILYNSDTEKLGSLNGHFSIHDAKWAAYQELINRTTGAKVLFIATHLIQGEAKSLQTTRKTETKNLFNIGARVAKHYGLPVVYAGDFNSATPTDPHYTIDSTHTAALVYRYDDAFFVAASKVNGSYDSANLNHRTPPKSTDRIDRIFTQPGVGVVRAGIEANPKTGVVPSDHNPVWADLEFPY
jgi:endonuclease/exonuclease/phosphatase family metal-dependent hydrolase